MSLQGWLFKLGFEAVLTGAGGDGEGLLTY